MSREALISGQISKLNYVRQRLAEMGFWFVDIPRTSSTSIRQALYERYGKVFGKPSSSQGIGVGLVPPHTPAQRLVEQLGPGLWNGLTTFTIVRNPFERVLSLYRFLQSNGALASTPFNAYVDRLVAGAFDYHGHYMSNWGYVSDGEGQSLVSEIFRFESRDSALQRIAEITSCPELAAGGRKTYQTSGDHYSHSYDTATRRKVERHFAEDLEQFGYRFETP
jgi:hypothetical protein